MKKKYYLIIGTLIIIILIFSLFFWVYWSTPIFESEQKNNSLALNTSFVSNVTKSTIKIWNFTASNNPEEYLGDYIGYESPSDWKNYEPLVNKVNELTSGLTNNKDKALSIANWVKGSKTYQAEGISIANSFGSIIDIFNADQGVCLDAAYLTTAMFRLVGIPVRAISPSSGLMHELTEAYVDEKWQFIDTTFGQGKASFPSSSDMDTLLRYIHVYNGYYENDNAYVFLVETESKEDYGTVQYPLVSERELDEWYKGWTGEDSYLPDLEFYCVLKNKEGENWNLLGAPGFYKVGARMVSNKYRNQGDKFDDIGGWILTSLPRGEYRFECSIRNVFDQKPPYQITYAEFSINSGMQTIINPEMFKKIEGADQKDFEILVDLINKTVSK